MEKPYPSFPLTPHPTGQWCKKIHGKIVYFGKDPTLALEKYNRLVGEKVVQTGTLTVHALCDMFLAAQRNQLLAGRLTDHTLHDYVKTVSILKDYFEPNVEAATLKPSDFTWLLRRLSMRTRASTGTGMLSPRTIRNRINCTRIIFRWAWNSKLLPAPVEFGPDFCFPKDRDFRAYDQAVYRDRGKRGGVGKQFSDKQVRTFIRLSSQPLRAMIWLGINGGFGNHDCGALPIDAVDLRTGWLSFPRPKTAIERWFPLWPETVQSLKEWLERRPEPRKEYKDRMFITVHGNSFESRAAYNPVGNEFRKVLDYAKCHEQGAGFSWLRHTFATIASGSCDQVAVNHIMGHRDPTIAATYREHITDERLLTVVNFVRTWLLK